MLGSLALLLVAGALVPGGAQVLGGVAGDFVAKPRELEELP
jgi:hypothetical protein